MSETFEVAGQGFTMEIVAVVRVSCDDCGDFELVAIEPATQENIKNWAEDHMCRADTTVAEYIAMGKAAAANLASLRQR